jgi:drug/metabolite transporter (DMT)-like permease
LRGVFGVFLATLSALSYGASDFSGAMASKDADSTVVTVAVQIVSLLTLALVLVVFPEDHRSVVDLAWGALGGLGAAVALVAFYRALAIGPMSTAASTTALLSATVPVLAGFLLGDRPGVITVVGIGLAVPAAVLVSVGGVVFHQQTIELSPRERATSRNAERQTRLLSIIAGLGFGLFFIALSRVSADAGLFPLLGARGASIASLTLVLTIRRSWVPIPQTSWASVGGAGVLDCAANSFYLLALGHGSFVWIAAVSSMYPVSTVLLARIRLHELLTRTQLVGIAGAAAALVLITVGAEI